MISNHKQIALVASLAVMCTAGWSAKVCIDPGHGGSDPGAVGGGQQEKTNVLNTGLKFRTWLNADTNDGSGGGSWQVLMTRTTDVFVSLSGRTNYANSNGVARFMSIHNNACGSCGASGTETFSYVDNGTLSNDLRNKIQSRSIQAWGLPNRGNKTANFHVLRETNMPATLAELGFIDSATDRGYLGNSSHQNNMAKYHMFALQNHYGITAYTPGTSLPTYVDGTPSVSANWATGTSASDKYGADYKWRSTAAISDAASFTINVGVAGSYKIQAWWPAGSNRSPSAPYILPNSNVVHANQQGNGGKWNTLGTVSLGTGNRTTSLSCWTGSGYIVVADAVRYTP